MGELIQYEHRRWEKLKELALHAVSSQHSRRAYETGLNDFLCWYKAASRPPISKALVQAYKAQLEARRLSASTINVRLSALRKLVLEAADNGLMPADVAAGIARVKGIRRQGVRLGNWLSQQEAEELVNAPDASTLGGKRDRALL